MGEVAAVFGARCPAQAEADRAEGLVEGGLSAEQRRQVLEAGMAARYSACYHPHCLGLLGQRHLDEIEARGAAERADAIVREVLAQQVRPIRGGAPAAPAKPRQVKPASGLARLTLTINGNPYDVRPVPCPAEGARKCYELRKPDGTHYHVSQHDHGAECTCADWVYRRDGLDRKGCKHLRSMQTFGLIAETPPDRGAPPDPFGPMPRRERSGQGTPPSRQYREEEHRPGLDTDLVGHPA